MNKWTARLFLAAAFCYTIDFVIAAHSQQLTMHWLLNGTGGAANDWAWGGVIFTVLGIISAVTSVIKKRRAR